MPRPLNAAMRRLVDVLERENLALKSMDFARTTALLPEKTAAIADLEAAGAAPPDPALVPLARRLDSLVAENQRLLERAITAQQRVIGIVVQAAATVAADASYRPRGRRLRLGAMALSTRA